MKRHHFSEISDKPWFPATLRELMTDILEYIIVRFRIYEPVIPMIKEVLRHMKTTQIIDLCSGGAGPWSRMQAQLQDQQESVYVTLTDKYPNLPAFEKIKKHSGNRIQYVSEAVDAANTPSHLKGMRTIFSAFHHFEPDAARTILQNTVNSRSAIGVFEFSEKRLDKIPFGFFLPLFIFLIAPFIKPRTFKSIFWVNIIPIIPWVLTCDAAISFLTTYSPKELKGLVRSIDSEGYVWKIGQVPSELRSVRITYLIGYPEDPESSLSSR
ncbi:MAG: hypothetical protein ABSA30_01025 [Candidatus Aminicenantales bacterium]|jgi:hypothetical protein